VAGMINLLPLSGWKAFSDFEIEGRARERAGEEFNAQYRIIDSNYFRTMGIPLLRGRELTPADRDQSPPVVLINETLARQYWPKEDPVGKRIRLKFSAPTTGPWTPRLQLNWLNVIGVVGDTTEWRYGEKKVCSKEGKLNEHDLFVIEVENRLQVRDKNVVEASEKAPHEEEHRSDAHGPDIRLLNARLPSAGGCANADCHVLLNSHVNYGKITVAATSHHL